VVELELTLDETNSSTLPCKAAKHKGNLRYIALDSQGLTWAPLSTLVHTGVDAPAALDILHKLLLNLLQINS